jgi:hypothetical protein
MSDTPRGELLRTLRARAGAFFAGADPLCLGEALQAATLLPDGLRETDALGPRLAAMDAALACGLPGDAALARSLPADAALARCRPGDAALAVAAVLAVAPDHPRALAVLAAAGPGGLPADTARGLRRRYAFRHTGLLEAPRDTRCHQLAPLPGGGFAALDAERPALYRFDASGRLLGVTQLPLTRTSGLALADGRTLVLTDAANRACLFLDAGFAVTARLDFARFDGAYGQDWTPYRVWADSGLLYAQVLGSRDGRFRIAVLPMPPERPQADLRLLDLPLSPFPLDLIPDGNRLWVLNFRPGLLCLYAMEAMDAPEAAPRLVRLVSAHPRLRAVARDGEELFLADEEALVKRDAQGLVFTKPLAEVSPEGKATLTHMLLVRHAGRRVLYLCDKTRRGIRRVEVDPAD